MERKHKITIISLVMITLILLIGTSYAYFSMRVQDTRDKDEETTKFKTCKVAEATTISDIPESLGSFQSTDIYPGHKEVIGMSVSARGDIHAISNFEFLYHINENTFGNNIKVSIYKSKEVIATTENYFACEKKVKTMGNQVMYYEECQEKDLGSLIEETILPNNPESIRIGKDSIVVTSSQEEIRYYYVVLEFLNQEDNQNTTMSSKLSGNITINPTLEKTSYKESILNGTDPILKDELIPVIIDNDGVVRKADEAEEWYSYEEKIWANAVILNDESEMYCPGEIIPEDNIESYFVWIPKYRYQIFNDVKYSGLTDVDNTKVQRIEVEFESRDVTPSNGNKKEEWLTHPAFTSFNSNGMWVGKFETSKSNSSPDNSKNPDGVQIKPNVVSWRNIQVGNAFYTTYDYKRNLDSHMIKNSEWGAVVYLQHSEYGSMTSVRINNNSDFITGYSSVKEPTCGYTGDNRECNKYGTTSDITQPYNTETGYLASTTGNISGIYDMSSGAWAFAMGVMTDASGNPLTGKDVANNSGFIGNYGTGGSLTSGYPWPEEKYYDKYAYGTSYSEYTRGQFGDATFEVGPFKNIIYANNLIRNISSWYDDHAYFVFHVYPWFVRSGAYSNGSESGQFSFSHSMGSVDGGIGFRVVLTP